MRNGKLIKILRTLTKKEFKRLGKFVQSDYFSTDENLVLFFNFLKKYHPRFSSKHFGKAQVFGHTFPGTPYSDSKMRNLISKMTALVEKYLIVLEWENDRALRERTLTRAYRNREIDRSEYEKKNTALGSFLKNEKPKNIEDYHALFSLDMGHYFSADIDKKSTAIDSLKKADQYLDTFYHIAKLKLSCESIARQKIINEKFSPTNHILFSKEAKAEPLGKIYFNIAELQKHPDLRHYKKAKDIFANQLSHIDKTEQQASFQMLLNFAIGQHNQGIKEYAAEVFTLYNFGLEKEILIKDGNITDATFLNISSQGSALGHFEWTKKFIEKYQSYLHSNIKGETVMLSWGYWHFFQKYFSEATDLLREISFSYFDHKIHSRWILVRCYFELFLQNESYYRLANSSILSFEKFLRRDKTIASQKKVLLVSTLSELKRIIKLKYNRKVYTVDKEKWIFELKSKNNIAGKNWLLNKIMEL